MSLLRRDSAFILAFKIYNNGEMIVIEASQLKASLAALDMNNLTPEQVGPLIQGMLAHIGSTDLQLRDELICTVMSLSISRGLFSPSQLRHILDTCLDLLFLGLGERETDSVFTRAFSSLVITDILHYQNMNPFLTPQEVGRTKDKVLEYAADERDFRGYLPIKGWSHSVAHFADCANALAQCKELKKDDLLEILAVINQLVSVDQIAYTFGEDERITTAVISVIQRAELSMSDFAAWMENISSIKPKDGWPNYYWYITNKKSFLRSLYFRTKGVEALADHHAIISTAVQRFAKGY